MKIALAALIALTPVSVLAGEYQEGYSETTTCYKEQYREEYVPGTADSPGYIKSWTDTIEYPCRRTRIERTPDNINSCLLYTSPSPRDRTRSRMPSSA